VKIAIVILNWNGKKLLKQFLPSVLEHSASDQVSFYVVDNASTDDSVNFLNKHYPHISLIEHPSNLGYARGYNEALKQIDADIYCLLNSDVAVSENWLWPIREIFTKNPETAIIQPKIRAYKQPDQFEYAGAGGGFIDALGYPYCRGRIFDTLEIDQGQYDDEIDIFWASGACFFIRASVFKALKGFDSHYTAHQEEIDLCWRAHNQGFGVKYTGASTVYHVGGATLESANPRKTFLNFRNSLFNLVKNLPSAQLIPTVFTRLVLDGLAGLRYLTTGKTGHFLAVLKAHASFYYYLPNMIQKRGGLTPQKHAHRVKSIVWAYFIRKKRRFNDL
jgi:hypothetical protein